MAFLSAWQRGVAKAAAQRGSTLKRVVKNMGKAAQNGCLAAALLTFPFAQAADETLGLRRPPAYTGRVQNELPVARPMPVSTATQVQPPQDPNEPLFQELPPAAAGASAHGAMVATSPASPSVDEARRRATQGRVEASAKKRAAPRETKDEPVKSRRLAVRKAGNQQAGFDTRRQKVQTDQARAMPGKTALGKPGIRPKQGLKQAADKPQRLRRPPGQAAGIDAARHGAARETVGQEGALKVRSTRGDKSAPARHSSAVLAKKKMAPGDQVVAKRRNAAAKGQSVPGSSKSRAPLRRSNAHQARASSRNAGMRAARKPMPAPRPMRRTVAAAQAPSR